MTNNCVFVIYTLIKQSKKRKHVPPLKAMTNEDNAHLSVVSILKEYLSRAKDFRDIDQLFHQLSKATRPSLYGHFGTLD